MAPEQRPAAPAPASGDRTAETTSADYRYFTSNGEVFRERDPVLFDRWLYGAGRWEIAAGTDAPTQEERDRLREITPAEAQRRIDSPEPIWAMHLCGGGREWQEAEDAIRDILFLYWDLTDYNGISGQGERGTFDAWTFLDCTLEDGWGGADTAQLLHQGAAVALLSSLVDWWDDEQSSAPAAYRVALDAGRFDHLPAARAAVVAGLNGPDRMYPSLDVVYADYVLTFFDGLSRPQPSTVWLALASQSGAGGWLARRLGRARLRRESQHLAELRRRVEANRAPGNDTSTPPHVGGRSPREAP